MPGVNTKTIDAHVRRIMKKLRVANIAELAKCLYSEGGTR